MKMTLGAESHNLFNFKLLLVHNMYEYSRNNHYPEENTKKKRTKKAREKERKKERKETFSLKQRCLEKNV